MKKLFYEWLNYFSPNSEEHKDVLRCFLAFPVILFAIIGMLGLILKLMR
jgi:hypothetical protein